LSHTLGGARKRDPAPRPKMVERRVAGGGAQDSRSMKPRIRNAHLLITHALDSCAKLLAVLHISSAQGRSVPHLCRVFIERGLPTTACRGLQIIPSQSNHQIKILMHLHLIKILRALMDSISVSFPVHPCPDGAAPVKRHNKSPIDATRVLIQRALVLMTFYPFERVAVPPKLVSMLLHYSSPPASLVSDVFSCEQILQRPSRMEFEL